MSNKIDSIYSQILEIDSQIKHYEDKIRPMKEKRKKYEKYIIDTIKTDLNNKNEFITSNKKIIKLNKLKKYEVISQKFLKNSLTKYFFHKKDMNYKNNAEETLKFLLDLRQNYASYVIKCK